MPFGADVKRQGRDVTVVGIHTMVGKALRRRRRWPRIELEVIDPRTLVPFDEETIIESVKKPGRLSSHRRKARRLRWRNHYPRVEAAFDYLDAPPLRVCARDVPVPYSAVLETAALPQVDDLIAAARALVNKER